jgi:predicted DNA binding CopG/RHH family protein
MRVAHLASVRKNKAINLSLSPDLWEWIRKKADNNGLRIPTSRVIAHLLFQVIEKEKIIETSSRGSALIKKKAFQQG